MWNFALILLSLASTYAPDSGRPPDAPARVLLVTGIDYPGHLWRQTAPVLRAQLEQDPRLLVTVVEDPNMLESPGLTRYDTVVLHFQNWQVPGPGPIARANLERFVRKGGGLVLTHFACGAWFGEWPEFNALAGRTWFGPDGGRQHDPYGPFTVEIRNQSHAVTSGLKDFGTSDELYTCLEGQAPIEILATAKSKVDGRDYPMAFVLEFGHGRVFHTPLGHDAQAFGNSGLGELLRRGVAWSAGLPPVISTSNGQKSSSP